MAQSQKNSTDMILKNKNNLETAFKLNSNYKILNVNSVIDPILYKSLLFGCNSHDTGSLFYTIKEQSIPKIHYPYTWT